MMLAMTIRAYPNAFSNAFALAGRCLFLRASSRPGCSARRPRRPVKSLDSQSEPFAEFVVSGVERHVKAFRQWWPDRVHLRGLLVDHLSDEQLMAFLNAGNMDALAALVQRHHDALLGYLYRLLGGDRPLAEDMAQETFTQALRHRNRVITVSFKAWLYTIATNLVRDYAKAPARRLPMAPADDPALAAVCDPAPGPEEQTLAWEQERQVIAGLRRLNAEHRTALLLRFYNGLSLQEIAQVTHIPVGTVKSRLYNGLRQLRAELEELEAQQREQSQQQSREQSRKQSQEQCSMREEAPAHGHA